MTLKLHDTKNPGFKDGKLIKQMLIDALMEDDIETFKDVLLAHLRTQPISDLSSKTQIGRQTLHELIRNGSKFDPSLSTLTALLKSVGRRRPQKVYKSPYGRDYDDLQESEEITDPVSLVKLDLCSSLSKVIEKIGEQKVLQLTKVTETELSRIKIASVEYFSIEFLINLVSSLGYGVKFQVSRQEQD